MLKEPTAFEEKVVDDQARLPSFTFCPSHHNDPISNKAIENFEDIEEAIDHYRHKYTIIIDKHKPYEQAEYGAYNYNDTSYGVWYLAPKISTYSPFDVVICLIWTPSRELKIEPDWSYGVSYHTSLINVCLKKTGTIGSSVLLLHSVPAFLKQTLVRGLKVSKYSNHSNGAELAVLSGW